MGQPGLFCLFSFFSNTNFTEKSQGISEIRNRIVKVEGEHADYLTTTTAQSKRNEQIMLPKWTVVVFKWLAFSTFGYFNDILLKTSY